MLKYEIKKVFVKTSSKIALVILFGVLCLVCWLSTDVYFVNGAGEKEYGLQAVRKLREARREWTGELNEEKIRAVMEENARINATPQARSKIVAENEIAYGWKQGIDEIRNLLNYSYAAGFRHYDYYRADSLTGAEAGSFYANRIRLLKEWLADEAADQFSDREKEYLIGRYEALRTPFFYDYMLGWTQIFEYAATVVMVLMLVLGYLVAGIFSNEFQYRADAVFFSSFTEGIKRSEQR